MNKTKTIQVNPELLRPSLHKKTRKNTTNGGEKEKSRKPIIVTPNNIKSKLLERIKQHKTKDVDLHVDRSKLNANKQHDSTNTDEFMDSMHYLTSLKRQTQHEKNKTLKHYSTNQPSNSINIQIDLPDELKVMTTTPSSTIPLMTSDFFHKTTQVENKYHVDNEVPYGCLKGGIKPTFKTLKNRGEYNEELQTQCQTIPSSTNSSLGLLKEKMRSMREKVQPLNHFDINIDTNTQAIASPTPQSPQQLYTSTYTPSTNVSTVEIPTTPIPMESSIKSFNTNSNPIIINTQNTNEINNKITYEPKINFDSSSSSSSFVKEEPVFVPQNKTIRKTMRKTYTLGRSKMQNKVGVLIKNSQTRKQIIRAQKEMKKKPINDVKRYLREHGLIKSGSNAPNDIVRIMYESSRLTGDVINNDDDVYLHNFLKEKESF